MDRFRGGDAKLRFALLGYKRRNFRCVDALWHSAQAQLAYLRLSLRGVAPAPHEKLSFSTSYCAQAELAYWGHIFVALPHRQRLCLWNPRETKFLDFLLYASGACLLGTYFCGSATPTKASPLKSTRNRVSRLPAVRKRSLLIWGTFLWICHTYKGFAFGIHEKPSFSTACYLPILPMTLDKSFCIAIHAARAAS